MREEIRLLLRRYFASKILELLSVHVLVVSAIFNTIRSVRPTAHFEIWSPLPHLTLAGET